ncbi:hypothetical protein HPB49_006352 [Dermacentor silvarum]|uniref:Uncharacterized protein n=1 Tax=Dermacentor silvarum TaxID=543639 RepID=A0ACB8C2D9_DERSI|nr:hypothetical protein HPB49_006352 [Dermacentor silvarum]
MQALRDRLYRAEESPWTAIRFRAAAIIPRWCRLLDLGGSVAAILTPPTGHLRMACVLLLAKKPAPRLPLVEIYFRKYRVNKPLRQKKKKEKEKRRRYNPCGHLSPPTENQVEHFKESLTECYPSLQALRYIGQQPAQQHVPEPSAQLIADEEDLWSDRVHEIISAHISSLKPIEKDDREKIRATTTGQADNKNWHAARVGRLTVSLLVGVPLHQAGKFAENPALSE